APVDGHRGRGVDDAPGDRRPLRRRRPGGAGHRAPVADPVRPVHPARRAQTRVTGRSPSRLRALLRDELTRERVRRQVRIWRLTARNAGRWARSRVRGLRADEERRAELGAELALQTAEDVARELGAMKGAVMKLGQMVSFIAEGLPSDAQAALASLQQDVPPMAPALARSVVVDELGADPDKLFLDWDPVPIAAASIGQVHRGVLHD